MMFVPSPIILIHRDTPLENLLRRWSTRGRARFVMNQASEIERARLEGLIARGPVASRGLFTGRVPRAGQSSGEAYAELEAEDLVYREALAYLRRGLGKLDRFQLVHRDYVPTFDFGVCQVVVVLGQDGMVANVAKYVGRVPIVGVNPDPKRIDGVLLPFQVPEAPRVVERVLQGWHKTRAVTLAETVLNDGQRMLAFNDFFIGCSSHASARYTLSYAGITEPQSSSGILVSTGAGSSGWLSSVFNMARGVAGFAGSSGPPEFRMKWEDQKLVWIVREPFQSRQSRTALVAGMLEPGQELVVESAMPERGVIFSDGIEHDCLKFDSGTIARVQIADQHANLVVS